MWSEEHVQAQMPKVQPFGKLHYGCVGQEPHVASEAVKSDSGTQTDILVELVPDKSINQPDESVSTSVKYPQPYHIRAARYAAARQRIFGDVSSCIRVRKTKRSTKRMRSFWKRVQGSRQKLISALFMNSDNRLYTDINVAGHHYVALLDSGASISCIGGTAAKVLGQYPKMRKCFG